MARPKKSEQEGQTPATPDASATVATEAKPESRLDAATQEAEKAGLHGRDKAYALFQRDEKGLLKNVNYVFKDDGSIDWKLMIPDEYIVVNTEYFERRQMQPPATAEGLDDKQKLVLLGGIKELAKIRGVLNIEKKVWESSNDRAVVSCKITFAPNYETDMRPFVYEEVASATLSNTNSFSQFFLETIASNRAFVRAVRNALRIDIVGSDELANVPTQNNAESSSEAEVWHALKDAAANAVTKKFPNGFQSFNDFKSQLVEKKVEGAENWNDWKDVPVSTAFKLISQLKKTTAAAAQQ
jgi:hypothetical protein